MVDVENLTDGELRTKLIEFGFPVMPITGTTRKVMVKKLKILMENQNKTGSTDRRSLGKFSSDEESDDAKPKPKDKNRRVTMAVPPMPTKSKEKEKAAPAPTEMEPPAPVKDKRRSSARTRVIVHVEKSPDSNSDSEPEIVETDYKQNYKIEVKSAPSKAPPTPSKKESPPMKAPEPSPSRLVSPSSPSRYSVYSKPTYDASEELDKIRSRLSLNTRTDYSIRSSTNDDTEETPFLSNFTRKLSQMSSKDIGSPTARSDVIKEQDTNGSMLYNRSSYLTNRPKPRDYGRTTYANIAEGQVGKNTNVSFILIAGVALFFVVLAALYYGMHSGSNSSEIVGLSVPYCQTHQNKNCLTEPEANGAIELYKIIKPLLITRAINAQCEGTMTFYMADQDIVDHIVSRYKDLDENEIVKDLNNAVILFFKNSFLGVSVLQDEMGKFTEATKATGSVEEYFSNAKLNHHRAFAVLSPSLPWKCSLMIKFAGLAKAIFIIWAIATSLWSTKYLYTWYKHCEQRSKDEVLLIVEKILDVVQTGVGEDNYMVINHVRDVIIPVDQRKKMESKWKKAVAIINENESRIRAEIQVVKGETYDVWRWVGSVIMSPKCNKSWQGQAFETQVGSPNSPPCSPTACLKIRGMVDESDRNIQTIREAVLVKTAEDCRILHCAVDLNSKCVYLRCADPEGAAVAYRNLHGWWYASHLVTVKYLRDERYMQRFPDSPKRGPPFLKAHTAK